MKRLLLIAATLITLAAAMSDEYRIGYKDGYKAGYCGDNRYCSVFVPYPPYPAYGQDNYDGGYRKGFFRGLAER